MTLFRKRVRSVETEERHYSDLKTVLEDPKTQVDSHQKDGQTIFILRAGDGRTHTLGYRVDGLKRKLISLERKKAFDEDAIRPKRIFMKRILAQ